MSRSRDPLLRAHLRRRTAQADPAALARIVARVDAAIDREPPRRRPRFAWPFPIRRLGLGATAIAAVLVVALAVPVWAPTLPVGGPGASAVAGGPPALELQVLSAADVRRILGSPNVAAFAGRTLVVESGIESAATGCPAPVGDRTNSPCTQVYRLSAFSHDVAVVQAAGGRGNFSEGMAVPSTPVSGPTVIRIVNGSTVELIGRPATDVGYELVWPVRALSGGVVGSTDYLGDHRSATVIVDGWLSEAGGSPRCLLQLATPPPGLEGFACGNPSWLTPDPVNPGYRSPVGGVRAQIGAYGAFAAEPDEDAAGAAIPRRALYVVELRRVPAGFDCFLCPDGLMARVVARLDPVAVP